MLHFVVVAEVLVSGVLGGVCEMAHTATNIFFGKVDLVEGGELYLGIRQLK